MTSEGLGEMFEGDSADTCARKFPLMLMGGRANGPACADGERGPPSARAEIFDPLAFVATLFNKLLLYPTKDQSVFTLLLFHSVAIYKTNVLV